MAEIFLNDLSQVRLFDVLKPLLIGKKTGVLSVRGKETSEIFLEMGSIVHARAGQTSGEEAFGLIMDLRVGKCAFEPEVTPTERTIPISTEQLLLNWSYRKQELEKVRKVVPSAKAIFRLSAQTGSEETNIKADQWKVLALTNGTKTVGEIAEELKWDEFRTSRVVCQLVQNGLLEKGEEPKAVRKKLVSQDFFPTIENELKRAMGPVAPFLIEDKLEEFGLNKEHFPRDRAGFFIDATSEEIQQEAKRKEFLKVMEEFLIREK
ncbi:MAG TPA: DUF4388 domain-containing protein [Thermodesulfobacteriota bacterium]|nr:DUF4388 domain-containing protein [Thermodesulfobacteriota bacterium]